MATLATQLVTRAGTAPTFAAAAGGGDRFTPGPTTWLECNNGSGGAITVTVVTPRTDQWGNAISDNAVSVPAGQNRKIGPWPAEAYGALADGLADVTYSGVTSLTVGVFSVS